MPHGPGAGMRPEAPAGLPEVGRCCMNASQREENVVTADENGIYGFTPTSYDSDKGSQACRMLADAYATAGDVDIGVVSEALGTAVMAFPGLQDFVTEIADRTGDPTAVEILLIGDVVPSGQDASMLVPAAAMLALTGAIAEAGGGFDHQEVADCAEACRKVLQELDMPSGFTPR